MPAPTIGNVTPIGTNDGSGASTISGSHNNNKSTVLVSIAFGYIGGAAPTDVKYGGVAMTKIASREADSFTVLQVWRLLSAAAGANTVLVGDGVQYSYVHVEAWSTDADTFSDFASINGGAATPYAPPIANMDADSLGFAVTAARTTTTTVPVHTMAGTARWTDLPALSANGNSPYHSGQSIGGTGTVNATFTPDTSVQSSAIGFRMSIAGGGGSSAIAVIVNLLHRLMRGMW